MLSNNNIMIMREYTPENITELKPNEVFVFGSNTAGRHGAGAAKTAVEKFGAKYGMGVGLQGQSYAIPTLRHFHGADRQYYLQRVTLNELGKSIEEFYQFAAMHPELVFYMTKIGTGLGGFTIEEISWLFILRDEMRPKNVVLPIEFVAEAQRY